MGDGISATRRSLALKVGGQRYADGGKRLSSSGREFDRYCAYRREIRRSPGALGAARTQPSLRYEFERRSRVRSPLRPIGTRYTPVRPIGARYTLPPHPNPTHTQDSDRDRDTDKGMDRTMDQCGIFPGIIPVLTLFLIIFQW